MTHIVAETIVREYQKLEDRLSNMIQRGEWLKAAVTQAQIEGFRHAFLIMARYDSDTFEKAEATIFGLDKREE